jgi:AraC-like DNA-binding protein
MEIVAKRRVSAPLDRHVESVWMLRPGVLSGGAVTVLPVGRASIAIALGHVEFHVLSSDGSVERSVASPMLCHAMAAPVSIGLPLAHAAAVVGINFRAGGLRAFTFEGLADLDLGVVALEQLWGERVRDWGQLIERAASVGEEAALALVEFLLVSQLREQVHAMPPMQDAVIALADIHDGSSVMQLAERNKLTPKAFRRAFRDTTGLNPKSFARVARFRGVLARLQRKDESTLTQIAAEHEYSDQAHFVHDFKALAGMTPSAYQARGEGQHACLFTRLKGVWDRLTGVRTAATSTSPDTRSDPRALLGP